MNFQSEIVITHEIEVGLPTEGMRDQPDHFVKRHSSIDDSITFRHCGHVCVHVLVHKPKCKRFISNESLK